MNFMKTNYHTHTYRCKHAEGTEEDYVKAAIENGLSILGFSDHGPFPDWDPGLRMSYSELDSYLSCIDRLSIRYASKIKLLKGLEIEYLPQYEDYYRDLLTQRGVDYLLLGEHFFCNEKGRVCNVFDPSSITDTSCYLAYADAVCKGMNSGYFQIAAHPDIFLMNPFSWDDNCENAAAKIIDTAMHTDTIIEYNANGLRREKRKYADGIRHPYPHKRFFEKIAATNIRVMVGSDCHKPHQVWDEALEQSYRNLEDLLIEPVYSLEKK